MNSKQRKTLRAIFAKPAPRSIVFKDIEALLLAVGCTLTEGSGSRVRFDKDEFALLCHRPHPGKEAKRYQVEDFRQFLLNIGVTP